MTLRLVAILFLLCAAAWASPPPQAPPDKRQSAELLALVGEGFRTRQTDHFTIAYDTSYEALRPLMGRLEGTYDAVRCFCEDNNLNPEPPAARLSVLLFDRYEDFVEYSRGLGVPPSVAGFYHHQTNIAAFCNTLSSPSLRLVTQQIEQMSERLRQWNTRRRGSPSDPKSRRQLQRDLSSLNLQRNAFVKKFNRSVIQHEAAHQILFNFGVHARGADNPVWLVEGLACQFEVPQTVSKGSLKRLNHTRLADFRDALGVAPGVKRMGEDAYEQAVDSGRFLPLDRLIAEPERLVEEEGPIVFRYAQAWGLVYYLHRVFREPFAAYLRKLRSRRPGESISSQRRSDDFRSFFGEPDEAFQRKWVTYLLKLRFDPHQAGR